MSDRARSVLGVVAINVVIICVCLLLIEVGFRVVAPATTGGAQTVQWLQFEPFMMFRNPYHPEGTYGWRDHIHDRTILAKITTNRLGFAEREPLDFATTRTKGSNERVVIFTGGSAAWGVGATSNDKTVAGRLQTILNERQARYKYTVLNLGMGGWVSVQQFIALAMYGRNLQPDWLVAMDGTNDAAVACAHSQGAGRVMHYALMDAYMKAYVFGQYSPVLYRSRFENELIKHSAAYRKLTGYLPVTFDLVVDPIDPGVGRSIITETTWADLERQLELYVRMEGAMVDLFPTSKVILSTQPLPFTLSDMFGRIYDTKDTRDRSIARSELAARNAAVAAASSQLKCGLNLWEAARVWFMSASALRIEKLIEDYTVRGRDAQYVNTGVLFPNLMSDRNAYFIDPVHLNDAGMDVVAHRYADMILAADKIATPDKSPELSGIPISQESNQGAENNIRIVEASYGLN